MRGLILAFSQESARESFYTVVTVLRAVRTVVGIVFLVRNDETEIRQVIICQIGCELGKRNQVQNLCAAVANIWKIGERVVVLEIRVHIAASVPHGRPALRV